MLRPIKLTLKQLEAFVLSADLGSFSRAAEMLNTTQPNVSSRISNLESILGVTLMERDAGSVRLTAKGRDLLYHARDVLRHAETLVQATGQGALIDGKLRLGVTELIVHTWLRAYLNALKDAFPNLTVELVVDISANIETELFANAIDLALQNEPFNRRASGNQPLGQFAYVWVAAPHLAEGLPDRPTLDELSRHVIVGPARGTRLHDDIQAHFDDATDNRIKLVPSSNLSAALHMAIDGMGIGILPFAMVDAEIKAGNLHLLNHDWVPQPLEFLARYDADRTPLFVAQAAEIAQETAGSFAGGLLPEGSAL